VVSFEKTEEADPGEVAGLRVLKYPHPLLLTENAEIEKFDYQLKQLTKRMFKLMYASRGVGLAAPQVRVNQRLMVVNWEGDPGMSGAELVLQSVDPRDVQRDGGRAGGLPLIPWFHR